MTTTTTGGRVHASWSDVTIPVRAGIKRVRRMADLPAVLADNVRSWPHYPATSETHPDDVYSVTYERGDTVSYDPLVSEDGERGEWRLTGYAEVATTARGERLFVLRFNASTFTYGWMTAGTTSLTIGGRRQAGTKAAAEEWCSLRVEAHNARHRADREATTWGQSEPGRHVKVAA